MHAFYRAAKEVGPILSSHPHLKPDSSISLEKLFAAAMEETGQSATSVLFGVHQPKDKSVVARALMTGSNLPLRRKLLEIAGNSCSKGDLIGQPEADGLPSAVVTQLVRTLEADTSPEAARQVLAVIGALDIDDPAGSHAGLRQRAESLLRVVDDGLSAPTREAGLKPAAGSTARDVDWGRVTSGPGLCPADQVATALAKGWGHTEASLALIRVLHAYHMGIEAFVQEDRAGRLAQEWSLDWRDLFGGELAQDPNTGEVKMQRIYFDHLRQKPALRNKLFPDLRAYGITLLREVRDERDKKMAVDTLVLLNTNAGRILISQFNGVDELERIVCEGEEGGHEIVAIGMVEHKNSLEAGTVAQLSRYSSTFEAIYGARLPPHRLSVKMGLCMDPAPKQDHKQSQTRMYRGTRIDFFVRDMQQEGEGPPAKQRKC